MSFHSVLLASMTSLVNKLMPVIYSYGDCTTARDVAAKTVTISGFKLKKGARVVVRFTTTTTTNPSSGNLTLNVNGTGAKNIVVGNSNKSTMTYANGGEFCNNVVRVFVYDGANWVYVNRDLNTINSAGASNKASTKLFLVGTTAQTNGVTSYSNSKCYVGADNEIYSNGKKVVTDTYNLSGTDTNDQLLVTTNEL